MRERFVHVISLTAACRFLVKNIHQSVTFLLGCRCSINVICSQSSLFHKAEQRLQAVRVTGRVSSRHGLPNREPLGVFLEGAGCRACLVTKTSTRHVEFHLHCNNRVSTSRWQSLYTFITEYGKVR